jgi:DNA-binding IclR family transcriptional regulator
MWSLLSNHGRALLCLAQDPDLRLRDLAARLGITERRAFDLVNDLTEAGYVIKEKDGRRNRYEVQDHLPLPDAPDDRTLGDILAALL